MAISSATPAPSARMWMMRRTRPSMHSRFSCHSSRSRSAAMFRSCRSRSASPRRSGSPICCARCWGPAPSSSSAPTSATTTPTRRRRPWTSARRLPSRPVIPTPSATTTPVGSSPCVALSSGRAAPTSPSTCSTCVHPPTPPAIRPGSSATAPSLSPVALEPRENAGGNGVAIVAGEPPERHVRTSLDFGDEAAATLADGGHDGPAAVEELAHGGHKPRRQALHLADLVDEIDVDTWAHGERGPRRGLEHARIDAVLSHAGAAAAVDVSHDRALAVERDQLEPLANAPAAHLLGEEPAETRAREPGRYRADHRGLANPGRSGDQQRHSRRPPSSARAGYVESRVAGEEAGRHEPEARAMDRHHWPVLWPWDVVDPHRVPENDIAVDERAVRLDPPRQAIGSTCLIHELAGRVLLRRIIGGDPEVRTEEASPPQQGRVGEEKWRAVLSRLEDIGDGLAESVPGPGVHDLPEAARAEI